MGKRNKVTTRDIAEYAGVSQSTVSMIHRKNTRRGAGADSGLIIRMEYEPELIARRTTGPA